MGVMDGIKFREVLLGLLSDQMEMPGLLTRMIIFFNMLAINGLKKLEELRILV